MIQHIISLKDLAAQAFGRPVFVPAPAVALRSFRDEINKPGSTDDLARHPADFELYQLGTYDDSTGIITIETPPRLLSRALDLVEKQV